MNVEITLETTDTQFHLVRSFVPSGVARLLAVLQRASSHRQRRGLGLAQCTSPLTMGLVLYILRAQLSRWVSPPVDDYSFQTQS